MPRKTKKYMQKMAYELSIAIKQADPFPFRQQSLTSWTYTSYVTDEDINFAKRVLTHEELVDKYFEQIILIAKANLRNRKFGKNGLFVDLKCFVK